MGKYSVHEAGRRREPGHLHRHREIRDL